MLPTFELFGPTDHVLLVIYQPKLDHIDEFKISVEHLMAFGAKAARAVGRAAAVLGAHIPRTNAGARGARHVLCGAAVRRADRRSPAQPPGR